MTLPKRVASTRCPHCTHRTPSQPVKMVDDNDVVVAVAAAAAAAAAADIVVDDDDDDDDGNRRASTNVQRGERRNK